MKKRVIALIGVIVLCLSLFAVPAFAAEKEVDLVLDHKGMSQNGVEEYIGISFIVIDNVRVEYRDVDGNRGSIEYGRLIGKGCNYTFNSETHYGFSFSVCLPGQSYTVLNSFGSSITPSSDGIISLSTSPGNIMSTVSCRDICLFYFPSNVRFCVYDVATHFGFRGIDAFAPLDVDSARQEGYAQGREDGYDEGFSAGIQSSDSYQSGFDDGVASVDPETIRQEGYAQGREEGYQSGYADAQKNYNDIFEKTQNTNLLNLAELRVTAYYYPYGFSDQSQDPEEWQYSRVPFEVTQDGDYCMIDLESAIDYVLSKVSSGIGSSFDISKFTIGDVSLVFGSEDYPGNAFECDRGDWQFQVISSASSNGNRSSIAYYHNANGNYNFKNFGGFGTPYHVPFAGSLPVGAKIYEYKVFSFGNYQNELPRFSTVDYYSSMQFKTNITAAPLGFRDGYAMGYTFGVEENYGAVLDTYYKDGLQTGYSEGYLAGKVEGLQINQNSDWKSLMLAVVEAPINTFQSLFNFEILGLDMRLAFGSILAVCVLLIIVKKVIL